MIGRMTKIGVRLRNMTSPLFFLLAQTSTSYLLSPDIAYLRQPCTTRRTRLSSSRTTIGRAITNENCHNDDVSSDDCQSEQTSSSLLEFHVAPMQCYTNASLRYLYRLLSPDAKLWTEMEKIGDLTSLDALERRFGPPIGGEGGGERRQGSIKNDNTNIDITLQLGGNDVTKIEECVKQMYDVGYQFDEINLNCGCPSIESGGSANYGASLMKQPALTKALLEAIHRGCNDSGQAQKHRTEVSLKCRIAVFETPDDMIHPISDKEYSQLNHYITQAEQAGISHVVLHARPAILSGLNPVKNRQVPVLDYSIVERIANDFPSLRVTLNGGIQSYAQLEKIKQEANCQSTIPIASFMAGRWMLQRPLDIIQVQDKFLSSNKMSSSDVSGTHAARHAIERYFDYVERHMFPSSKSQVKAPLAEICLPLYLLSEQLREDYDVWCDCEGGSNEDEVLGPRHTLLSETDIEMLYDTMREGVEQIQDSLPNKKKKKIPSDYVSFKNLSASFKGIVGTKVVNKWKRNRAEL